MLLFGIAALIPLVFSFQKFSQTSRALLMLQAQLVCVRWKQCQHRLTMSTFFLFYANKWLQTVYYYNYQHALSLFIFAWLSGYIYIWWLKWKVCLPSCLFSGKNVMLHLKNACVVTLRLQHHDYIWQRMNSDGLSADLCPSADMLILCTCAKWRGKNKHMYQYSIFPLFLLLPFIKSELFVFEFTVQEFLKFQKKNNAEMNQICLSSSCLQ